MKLTINQVLNMNGVLTDLAKTCKPFKVSYWITRNIKALRDTLEFYTIKRTEIFDKYVEKDERGRYVMEENIPDAYKIIDATPERIQEVNDVFNELLDTECDITIYPIELSTLMDSDVEMTAEQITVIECLIKE